MRIIAHLKGYPGEGKAEASCKGYMRISESKKSKIIMSFTTTWGLAPLLITVLYML